MTKLYDILDWAALQGHIQRKEITERKHPQFPNLVIYNYADVVAYQKLWTPETRAARGLIVDLETMDVLARPFAKFFNYGQQEAGEFDLDAEVYHVANKYDGSLGIVYMQPNGLLAVATRGSFESDQAKHATEMLRADWGAVTKCLDIIRLNYTPLYEIIYPENRIVVDYGTDDKIVYLGRTGMQSGSYVPDEYTHTGLTLRGVLEREPRKNAEGWVVWLDPFTAVKIKQEDYVALHRIVTGLNRKSVWRALSEGEPTYQALVEQLPDELYAWADGVAKELREEYADIMQEADGWYISTLDQDVWEDENDLNNFNIDRKKFALTIAENVPSEYRGYVFALADNKDIQTKIWKQIEPRGGDK